MNSLLATLSLALASFNIVTAAITPIRSSSASVSYDPVYDNAGSSLNIAACGSVLSRKYPTFGNLPGFPHIGGALTIAGTGSPNCGKCYELHFTGNGVDKSITVLAIDTAPAGFNIGLQAMNDLTDGQAEQLGRVQVTWTEVNAAQCA
ncbi:Heat-stable 19 kDa antigen [Penicillium oxalicum]|uniref:Heat-stable 19 kDa antigen n=1 Tax=Penicillium oxalicum TaxID=69781 RepID=UPI0020B89B8D|nr:Heat-stable 19 kDa antigen [Penicillium oxalicum]KAI2789249.1 Heat-stable 19 kDa antigen [Penicillium oxalicum]